MKLKTIHVPRGYEGLHLEIDGAIVNVYVGLQDTDGHKVTSVGIRADRYCGEPNWSVEAGPRKMVEHLSVRVVQETDKERARRIRRMTTAKG
jgi:hypothetical protein